jgi:hypothetical protein
MADRVQSEAANLRWEFETVVVGRKGKDANKVFAALTWGFQADKDGKLTSLPFAHHDSASKDFMLAVAAWNAQAEGALKDRNGTNQETFGPLR